jgi:hypothetical protein
MNNKDIQKMLDKLKQIPIVLIPITFIIFLLFIIFGISNKDSFINLVGPNDEFLQSFGDEITATILNDDGEEKTLTLEVAKTQTAIAQGLMYRTFLPYDSGMLFVYTEQMPRVFWMKDTYIPLDIIFVDSDKRIINIIENAEPLDENTDKYKSEGPAQYVIEVNGGWTSDNKISKGNSVFF